MLVPININRLHPDAIIPTYAHPGDAGADLYAVESYLITPGRRVLIPTGIAIAIPEGYVGLIHPRSGLAWKQGLTVTNAPGTIDSGYRGEILVNVINLGQLTIEVEKGDRIAQLVFQEVCTGEFFEVADLDEAVRGDNGFGSTGD
jgi:dUTP pyrophosphatase